VAWFLGQAVVEGRGFCDLWPDAQAEASKERIQLSRSTLLMQTKDDIVADWLPRYTGTPLDGFGKYILLVNFSNYVRLFAECTRLPFVARIGQCSTRPLTESPLSTSAWGSASAATVMTAQCNPAQGLPLPRQMRRLEKEK